MDILGNGGAAEASPPAMKQRAVGSSGKDVQEVLNLVVKLSLSSAQQVRLLKAIMLTVIQLATSSPMCTASKAETVAYSEQSSDLQHEVRLQRFGLPHVHAWNGLIKALQQLLAQEGNQQELLAKTA
mmetsp:Transcript_5224/g.9857  ORF Transcript_5224/g.9857 Transcript_5224/m.9857 type:complete len:127 (+) Transcript_5224:51-431(+)